MLTYIVQTAQDNCGHLQERVQGLHLFPGTYEVYYNEFQSRNGNYE